MGKRLFSHNTHTALWPTSVPVIGNQGYSHGSKANWAWRRHWPPSSAKVRNKWNTTSRHGQGKHSSSPHVIGDIHQQNMAVRITWTNKMRYFILIYFNNKPLHVSSTPAVHHQENQLCINSNWYSHVLFGLYQLLFIQSWSSRWWAASLLKTCRGLLLK